MEEGELVAVLPGIVGRDRPRRLVTAKAMADTPLVAAFLEQTRAVASTLLGTGNASAARSRRRGARKPTKPKRR
jgi:hypothetical protein